MILARNVQPSIMISTTPVSAGVNAIVAGAGTAAANGTYSERGTYNGFPYYNKIGEGDDPEANSIAFFLEATAITGPSGELWYYVLSEDPTDSPWDTEEGDAPAPTVTQG